MLKRIAKKSLMLIYSAVTRTNFLSGDVFAASCPYVSKKNKVVVSGNRVYIGRHCHFGADVVIGNYVLIASHVSFVGGDHRIDVVGSPMFESGRDTLGQVTIEDDVWIGHGAVIMHNVSLGCGCVVGAGAVVTESVPAFAIVGGVPATILRYRFGESDQARHRAAIESAISISDRS
jgi:acetyltransferase-like isoleucine patch superfamily enzyme